MDKNTKLKKYFLQFAVVFIPLHTLLLASNASWTKYNLSIVGNYFDKRLSFVLWGLVTGAFLMLSISDLFRRSQFKNKGAVFFFYFACVLFVGAVLLPYLPDIFPKISGLHELFAFFSPIILLFSLYIFVSQLVGRSAKHFKSSMLFLSVAVVISVLLLFAFGIVTSLLEIFVVIALVIFLRDLSKKLADFEREEDV